MTTDTQSAIYAASNAADKLTAALAGTAAFPLGMLLDEVINAIQSVVDGLGDADQDVRNLIGITGKRVISTLYRVEGRE